MLSGQNPPSRVGSRVKNPDPVPSVVDRFQAFNHSLFTDYFSGPGRAINRVYVCLCVWAITFELNDL